MKSNSKQRNFLSQLLLRLFLALPPLYALWFMGAEIWFAPVSPLTQGALSLAMPQSLEAISLQDRQLLFDTRYPVQTASGQWGHATMALDLLMYTFNLPLLIAMIWASRGLSGLAKATMLAYLALLPTWVWSASFWYLKTIALDLGAQVRERSGIGPVATELVGLGYQFGTLILPSLAVVLIWAWLCPAQLRRLFTVPMQQRAKPAPQAGKPARTRRRNGSS